MVNGKVVSPLGDVALTEEPRRNAQNGSGVVVACQTNGRNGYFPTCKVPKCSNEIYPASYTAIIMESMGRGIVLDIKTVERECPVLDEFQELITVPHLTLSCEPSPEANREFVLFRVNNPQDCGQHTHCRSRRFQKLDHRVFSLRGCGGLRGSSVLWKVSPVNFLK